LFVGGKTMIKSNLTVQEDVSLNSRFFVFGDVSFNSNLFIENDLSMNGNFSVLGDANITGKVNTIGNITTPQITVTTNGINIINGNLDMKNKLQFINQF